MIFQSVENIPQILLVLLSTPQIDMDVIDKNYQKWVKIRPENVVH